MKRCLRYVAVLGRHGSVSAHQGDFVWLDTADGSVPIGAEVTLSGKGDLQLVDDEGKVKALRHDATGP